MAKKQDAQASAEVIQVIATVEQATISVPLGPVPGEACYLSDHVEARLSTQRQRIAMRRLQHGLQESGARLADGRPVGTYGDAVRWLMERIGEHR